MFQKLLVSAFFVLSTATVFAAESSNILPLESAGGNSEAIEDASSPFAATVLDLPAECARPQDASTGLDPEVCSTICSDRRCRGKAPWDHCSPEPAGYSVCYPMGPVCSDGPNCGCGLARPAGSL